MRPIWSGWLSKRGAHNTAFQTRWMEIYGDRIDYRKSPSAVALKGSIALTPGTSLVLRASGDGFVLEIAVPAQTRTYVLRGAGIADVHAVLLGIVGANSEAPRISSVLPAAAPLPAAPEAAEATSYAFPTTKKPAKADIQLPAGDQVVLQVLPADDELRHRDAEMARLEQDLLDLNGMFRDLSSVVVAQREQLDTLEANVDAIDRHVTEGTAAIVDADKLMYKFSLFGSAPENPQTKPS